MSNYPTSDFSRFTTRYVSLFAMLLILVSQPWGWTTPMSVGTWIIFIAAIYDFLKALRMRFTRPSALILFTILLLSFCSLLAAARMTYRFLVALFCFWEIPIFLQFSTKDVSKKFVERIYHIFLALSLYYMVLFFTPVANVYGNDFLLTLTLGYSNPNQTGMYLLVCFFILFSATSYYKRPIVRFIYSGAAILIGLLIFGTGSRACILLALAYTVYYIFFSKNSWPVLTTILTKIAFWVPIAVFIFIMFFTNLSRDLQFMGETFETGRFSIYSRVFENYSFLKFLLGDFARYRYDNLHNAYLSVFATSGIIVAIFFVIFLRNRFLEIHQRVIHRHQQLAYMGLVMLVVHMSIEAAFFTAGSVYAISVMSLVWIATQKHQIHDIEDE